MDLDILPFSWLINITHRNGTFSPLSGHQTNTLMQVCVYNKIGSIYVVKEFVRKSSQACRSYSQICI
uniref:Uncharacterized protein n=1 Tax=Octopus bimaculoides TaxID=37653 RepID=A0A0L8FKM2_OCTBM